MSRFNELISELCPDGVKYKTIKEFASVSIGEFVHQNKQNPNYPYPVYNGGTTNTGFYDEYNRTANKIIVSARGNAGFVNRVFVNFWSGNSCYTISIEDKLIDWNFVYYYLKSNEGKLINIQQKGGIPAVSKKQVEEFRVPLPPLPVQQEIVRILDNFTELTAELTAELEARKKQYEYYRDELLTFEGDVPRIELGKTCRMKSGKAISSSQITKQRDGSNSISCYGGNGVRGFVKKASHYGDFPVIGRQGALCGNISYATGDFYATEHAVVVQSLGQYNQRFLFYLLTAMNLNQFKSQGAQPGLAVSNIENIFAPLPPLAEQARIVAILDRFDTLTNDITQGLPAEIAARRKQYEYYRDRLLTFKEASS